MFHFDHKVILVTGAGAGIGKAAAKAYAKNGGLVVVNSRSDSGKETVNEIISQGGNAVFAKGDVGQEEDVKQIVQTTVDHFHQIDVVVNCAGVVCGGNVEETDLELWNDVMTTNVTGTFLVCKYAIPYLRQSKGVIVNISSLVAVKGITNRAVYSASKGAVLSLSRAMAADYINDGIRVNVVSPGTVLSPSLEKRIASEADPEAAMLRYVSRQPLGRLGKPEEIAAAILFASSEEAGFLDGTNIRIDGAASL